MAIQFHINGRCDLGVDFTKASSTVAGTALNLGYSVDGVTIELHYETDDIMTDAMGNKIPEEVQNMGQWATVKCQLVKYDNAVLQHCQDRLYTAGDTYGYPPNLNTTPAHAIGYLMRQCNYLYQLYVSRGVTCTESGATGEGGYLFGCAYLADVDSFKLGTQKTVHDLTFRCLPDSSGVLFSKMTSSIA